MTAQRNNPSIVSMLNKIFKFVRIKPKLHIVSFVLFIFTFTILNQLFVDCITNGNSNTSSDRVYVVKSAASNPGSYKKAKDSFNQLFDALKIEVRENTPIGSKLADIQADDPQNSKLTYAILDGPDRQSFDLKVDDVLNKAELINEVNLDFESTKKNYHIVIRATSLFLRYEVDIDIKVMDENDNRPRLDDFTIIFNNYKNNFPTTPIGRVPASDLDVNDQLRYRVLSGNNAQLIAINETTGEIQLSPWLNSNVPSRAVFEIGVSDGMNEEVAQLVLVVNLVTETMLQNSVVLRLDGVSREEFLTKKFDIFLNNMARILGPDSMYGSNNIVVFNVEESIQSIQQNEHLIYRSYSGSSIVNSTISVNISFSARADGNHIEAYLTNQYIEEKIFLNRLHLEQVLEVSIAPFQDNLCVQEPCQNYQECQATFKFERISNHISGFITVGNMIFRPIKTIQSYACNCPPTFTGMNQKSECNLQINQCFSNPCMNGGICHRHESGYSCECKPEFIGHRCEHSFANSTCQSILEPAAFTDSISARQVSNLCSGKSRCVNTNRSHFYQSKPGQLISGFSCQSCSYSQWSNDLCQLRARSFSKGSYVTLPSIRRRHQLHVTLRFATIQSDALLMYNGRYNDNHDFIALEIVDSHLKFSYSLGSAVTSVSLPYIFVSTGDWHKVTIDYKDRNVTILVDDCDPVIDEAKAKLQGTSHASKRCSNTSYSNLNAQLEYHTLDLTSPLQIGGLPSMMHSDNQVSTQKSFVGCISDIYIDHQLVDLHNPIQDFGTQPGCLEKISFCQQHSCNGFACQESWGTAKCSCSENYIGRSCETLISNEKVRKFNGNSYLTFSPIESKIVSPWQISMHFRTMNPNGFLMKISLDSESNILFEIVNGGLRISHNIYNMTFNKINLDDGEWHFIEFGCSAEQIQLKVDYNPNLAIYSNDMGTILGATIKTITMGAQATKSNEGSTSSDTVDFSSSIAGVSNENYQNFALNGSQSFVGCIYGVNVSDNAELWISTGEERNVERGCQAADVCEDLACPSNSRCVKKGMNKRECICNPGYIGPIMGDRCVSICDLNPCQGDSSKCYPITTTENDNNSNHYRCECEPNRIGKNCEHQLSSGCPSNWWGRPVAGSNSSICGPCNCDETKGFNGDCHKTTGQCFCKPNHYQPAGSDYCSPCDCYIVGSLSATCNQTSGQCKCRSGVVGTRCDSCSGELAEVTLRGCDVVYDTCPKTFSNGIWWSRTQPNKIDTQRCPEAISTGSATRLCHQSGLWQQPNMFDCISNTFTDLYNQFKLFEEKKFPMTSSLAIKIATNLRKALNETITNPTMQLYGSDMYISFRLLHHLLTHESQQTGLNLTHKQDRMFIKNIAESINYILDPSLAENWPEISARSPNGGPEHILKLFDNYGKALIESQSDTFTPPFEVSTKYFTFGMDTISSDQLWDISKTTHFQPGPTGLTPYYATDLYGLSVDHSHSTIARGSKHHYNADGSSVFLDYGSTRDGSPAISIPKYDNYASDLSNQEDTTKALIPLKTLRIKTLQELLPPSYFQAKSRAKRDEITIPDFKSLRQQPAIVVYSIYRSLGPLLPGDYDNTVQHRLGVFATSNSPVVWLTVRPVNSTELLNKNIQPKITYMLKVAEPIGKTRPQCAIWDFNASQGSKNQSAYGIKKTGKFSTKGCEITGIHFNYKLRYKYDYINCSCDHIGAVTVLMDNAYYDYISVEETNYKDLANVIALAISIALMITTSFILSCVRGHTIKSNSNSINKNLLFVLIIIEFLVLYSVISRGALNQYEYQCKLVAIFLHYFSISLFFWLLVNAIHFFRMLTELRDINHGPMKFYHVLGFAIPGFFVSIAVGLRMEQFGNDLFCWLSIHEPIIWSMFGPISIVSIFIITLFLLTLCKSLPVKEDANGADLVKNHILINLIKTPLIGIYWLTLVYAVNEALSDYLFLFPIVAVLKSFILLILLCMVDKHIRFNLYVYWLRFRGEPIQFMDESLNYGSSVNWLRPGLESSANVDKNYLYAVNNAQITTPGFQSSCTDIFRPEVLAYSEASTTSRSSASEVTVEDPYHRHRNKDRDEDYGRSRSGRHRRRHKKSHRKHHHHKHHHHHHHHRSHHHEDDYTYRRRSEVQRSPPQETNNTHHELASSHSSDDDDASTFFRDNNIGHKKPETSSKVLERQIKASNENEVKVPTRDEQQTVPMELPGRSNDSCKVDNTNDNSNDKASSTLQE